MTLTLDSRYGRGVLRTSSSASMQLASTLERTHRVVIQRGALHADRGILSEALHGRDALVVFSSSASRYLAEAVLGQLAGAEGRIESMVLQSREATKTMEAVLEVAHCAASVGLRRMSPIIAVGGGVCTDICGVAASLHHRGVPLVKVPTSLLGLVDAGIGSKNAVNTPERKSALGSFHPPELSVLDPEVLRTLPPRQFHNGIAEIVKLAAVNDRTLFEILQKHAGDLIRSRFVEPLEVADEVLARAVRGMMSELAQNPFELGDLRRRMDFGHTFSPYWEVASRYGVLHGEAVAMDMALSAQVAHELELLSARDLESLLGLLEGCGLRLTWDSTRVDDLWASLAGVVQHRAGDLHLVVPTSIGNCAFLGLGDVNPALLRRSLSRLDRWDSDAARFRISRGCRETSFEPGKRV